jgi:hypothetical protein
MLHFVRLKIPAVIEYVLWVDWLPADAVSPSSPNEPIKFKPFFSKFTVILICSFAETLNINIHSLVLWVGSDKIIFIGGRRLTENVHAKITA